MTLPTKQQINMTSKYWVRSTVFNISFLLFTALVCIICLPSFFLPRKFLMGVVHSWTWGVYQIEKYILGLKLELRGLEHLPEKGSYIIAAKHQSPYETLKLHMLFGDPAIVLKQELLKIPLWGAYLKKADNIAIDRSNPEAAITSLKDGAKRVQAQGRPIVIFPQGTRVPIYQSADKKPYKVGIARIQDATNLPIIPMAINAGYFWPRSGFLKRKGSVVFEFLPAINPGLPASELVQKLEATIEPCSNALLHEAIRNEQNSKRSNLIRTLTLFIILAATAYSAWWFYIADQVKKEYRDFLIRADQVAELQRNNIPAFERHFDPPSISGFPGKIILEAKNHTLRNSKLSMHISDLKAQGWPFPNTPIHLVAKSITLQHFRYAGPIVLDHAKLEFEPKGNKIALQKFEIKQNDIVLNIFGDITLNDNKRPNMDLTLHILNNDLLLNDLKNRQIIDSRAALFAGGLAQSFMKDGELEIPLKLINNEFYIGPFMVARLP